VAAASGLLKRLFTLTPREGATHRSFLVNLEHVRKVEVALYGDYVVHMSDGSKLRRCGR